MGRDAREMTHCEESCATKNFTWDVGRGKVIRGKA
jgi:hypothetical protein